MIGTRRNRLERKVRTGLLATIAGVALLLVMCFGFTGSANADDYPVTTPSVTEPPTVLGTTITQTPHDPGSLPVTGADIAGMVVIGGGMVLVGMAVMRLRKSAASRAA
jgi:hypothetical protein